jgi:hypothetical protein
MSVINGIPYPNPQWQLQPRFNPVLSGTGIYAGVAAGNQPGTFRKSCNADNSVTGNAIPIGNGVGLGTAFASGAAPTVVPVQLAGLTLIQNQAGG